MKAVRGACQHIGAEVGYEINNLHARGLIDNKLLQESVLVANRLIGSVFLVAGTTIGAGMLALPIVSFPLGFSAAIAAMVLVWVVMLCTAYTTLKVTLSYPQGSSFHTMALDLLGKPGWWVVTFAILGLFYALIAAYTAGASNFIALYVDAPKWLISTAFVLLLGGVVTWKTAAVDQVNRLLFILKMLIFAAIVLSVCLMSNEQHFLPYLAEPHPLSALPAQTLSWSTWSWQILLAFPIYVTSFGFHGSIPSLVKYVGKQTRQLKWIFLLGSGLALCLYILWCAFVFGYVPSSQFSLLLELNDLIQFLVAQFAQIEGAQYIGQGLNYFVQLAILTSFLGVSLGLLDFFKDMMRAQPFIIGAVGSSAATFIVPLVIVLFYPDAFASALNFAGIALVILAIVIPNLMLLQQAKRRLTVLRPLEKLSTGLTLAFGSMILSIEAVHLLGLIS